MCAMDGNTALQPTLNVEKITVKSRRAGRAPADQASRTRQNIFAPLQLMRSEAFDTRRFGGAAARSSWPGHSTTGRRALIAQVGVIKRQKPCQLTPENS